MKNLFIVGRNVKLTKPIKNFVKSGLSRHQRVAKKYSYLKVEILKEGDKLDDVRIKISMSIESKYIRIERRGKNFYELFNSLQKSLFEEIQKIKELELRKSRANAVKGLM